MEFYLGFDKIQKKLDIDKQNILGQLEPKKSEKKIDEYDEVHNALKNPIGTKRLKEIVNPDENIVIITSDITRPMPSKIVLPEILKELYLANVKPEKIKIVFALGNHRKHTEEEKKYLVGEEVYNTIECIDSDVSECKRIGETKNKTPLDVFKVVAEADRRICLGNIEYHYFAGYSGGAKAIMPGVSSREAIQANHSKMVMEQAKAGNIPNNPVRDDIDEVAEILPIDFIFNVVLDEHKNIIKAVAGHYIQAHREGCKYLDSIYKVKIKELADIVIVSPGGYPKDINMYQAQKALDNAKHAVKEGGIIIWVASCREGLGEEVFEEWIKSAKRSEDMIERIKSKFELGGHKAAAIAMVLSKCDIYLVSDLDEQLAQKAFLKPFSEIDEALLAAFEKLGKDSKVLLMPYGGSTLPVLEK